MIGQVAAALDAAHARGLVHRDVKPANVLLTTDEPEHAYLTDFGVSKRVGVYSRLTNAGQWVGTLDYLSPEQIRGEEVGPAADTYMLAGLLYHCLTGQPPFVRDSQAAALWAHLSAPCRAPSVARPELPPRRSTAVIARGLAKDPAARYRSAGRAGRGLRGGRRPRAAEPPPPPREAPPSRADGSGTGRPPRRGPTRSCPTSPGHRGRAPARVRAG